MVNSDKSPHLLVPILGGYWRIDGASGSLSDPQAAVTRHREPGCEAGPARGVGAKTDWRVDYVSGE